MKVNEKAALENLVRVCEASLSLIRQLIESQDAAYTAGYEDGMAVQKQVQAAIIREQRDDIRLSSDRPTINPQQSAVQEKHHV
jgi:hypothetical protein